MRKIILANQKKGGLIKRGLLVRIKANHGYGVPTLKRKDSLAAIGKPNPNVRVDERDLDLDNGVSRQPWPWLNYIGQSKTQRILLSVLHDRDLVDGEGVSFCGDNVWRGAVSLRFIKQLLFKGRQLSTSERASFCRSIRRLEQDGLINRERGMSDDGYTTHIGLTQRGWYQAEFNRTWYSNKQEAELLTFYGLLSSKYGKKVNKKHKKVNRG